MPEPGQFRAPMCTADTVDGAGLLDPAAALDAPHSDAAGPDELLGVRIDERFELVERLGHGGMGVVYRARQHPTEREVAIKLLRPELAGHRVAVQRFLTESQAVSRLQHPNTVTVFDFGQDARGRLYIAMELLKGPPLSRVLCNEGAQPAERAVAIAIQIAEALADAHARGVIHRDLKPENIHLEERHGHSDFVKVLDFGVAKLTSPGAARITRTGSICGTAAYMSPEVALGRGIGPPADLYSLGIVLFEMLAGQLPFHGSLVQLAHQHVHATAPRVARVAPRAVPGELDEVVARLLRKEAPDRFQSAMALRDELVGIQHTLIMEELHRSAAGVRVTEEFAMPDIEDTGPLVAPAGLVRRRGVAPGLAVAIGVVLVALGWFARPVAEPREDPLAATRAVPAATSTPAPTRRLDVEPAYSAPMEPRRCEPESRRSRAPRAIER